MSPYVLMIIYGANGLCGGPHYTTEVQMQSKEACYEAARQFDIHPFCDSIQCVPGTAVLNQNIK